MSPLQPLILCWVTKNKVKTTSVGFLATVLEIKIQLRRSLTRRRELRRPATIGWQHNDCLNILEINFLDRRSPIIGDRSSIHGSSICPGALKRVWSDFSEVKDLTGRSNFISALITDQSWLCSRLEILALTTYRQRFLLSVIHWKLENGTCNAWTWLSSGSVFCTFAAQTTFTPPTARSW